MRRIKEVLRLKQVLGLSDAAVARGARVARSTVVAVGTGLAASPPRRSRRAAFPHRAPVSGDTVAPFGVWATHAVAQRDRAGAGDTPTRCCARSVPCRAVSP